MNVPEDTSYRRITNVYGFNHIEYLLFSAYSVALNNASLLELPAVFPQRIASPTRCDA